MSLPFARPLAAALSLASIMTLAAPPAGAASSADKARFSSETSYEGAPKLPLTVSMVVAGGGPAHFQSTKLVGTLAGAKTKAEVAKLTKQFGSEKVGSFLKVFTYAVDDGLRIVTAKKIALPGEPEPSPSDGKALSAALYSAGVVGDRYNVEVMLDKLLSHPIHVQVMDDIDGKFGQTADANFHIVLTQAMLDLKSAYNL
jgi:hypothetical protein